MNRRDSVFSQLDITVIALGLFLIFFGWINIYAAGYKPEYSSIFSFSQEYGKQFIWIGTGIFLFLIICLLDSSIFTKLSYLYYGAAMALLVAVLIFGKEVNGAKSWFGVGSVGFQPSEFAKIACALLLSKHLSDYPKKSPKNLLMALGIIALPCILIMLQPDTGTVLVFTAFILILYRFQYVGNIILAGILAILLAVIALIIQSSSFDIPFTSQLLEGKYLLVISIILLGGVALLIVPRLIIVKKIRKRINTSIVVTAIVSSVFVLGVNYGVNEILSPHQTSRVNILLGLEEDPQGAGYNVKQSKTSIGSGGFAGKGFLNGTLTKFKYVPMQSTDFIFCTVGEEWGFLGTSVVVIAFCALIIRLFFLADRQRSQFSKAYIYAIACIFFMHLLINVGMTIGLAPVIGIPLPFFSYGGSSLVAFILMLAIALRLDAERLNVLR